MSARDQHPLPLLRHSTRATTQKRLGLVHRAASYRPNIILRGPLKIQEGGQLGKGRAYPAGHSLAGRPVRGRRWRRVGAAFLGAVALTPLLASCGQEEVSKTAVVVVTRASELAPVLSDADRALLGRDALNPRFGKVDVYVIAGGRAAVPTIDLVPRRGRARENVTQRARPLVEQHLDEVQQAVDLATREGSSADPLRALDVAARTGADRLIVLGALVTTTDPFDMRKILFSDRAPADVTKELVDAGALPNLSGRAVVLSGVGRTAAPQDDLGVFGQARLRAVSGAVCAATGATCSFNDEVRPALPSASPVTGPVVPIPTMETKTDPDGSEIVSVPSAIMFEPNSCTMIDRSAAAAMLDELAARLRAGKYLVSLSGRIAPVGADDGLSYCRAKATADLLVNDLGVPASAIAEVRGDGAAMDSFDASHDERGRLDPSKLPALRRVVLTITPKKEA